MKSEKTLGHCFSSARIETCTIHKRLSFRAAVSCIRYLKLELNCADIHKSVFRFKSLAFLSESNWPVLVGQSCLMGGPLVVPPPPPGGPNPTQKTSEVIGTFRPTKAGCFEIHEPKCVNLTR